MLKDWNKDEDKYNQDCPFNAVYKGTVGRKKFEEISNSATLSNEHIMSTLRNKSRSLKNKDNEVEIPGGMLLTRKVVYEGGNAAPVANDDGTIGSENTSGRIYINSIDAAFITPSYLDLRRCVFSKIKNVQIRDSEGEKFAYLSTAFYFNEDTSIK